MAKKTVVSFVAMLFVGSIAVSTTIPEAFSQTNMAAMSGMSGMSGQYRVGPDGSTYLYPAGMAGMGGMSGMSGMQGMSGMGGTESGRMVFGIDPKTWKPPFYYTSPHSGGSSGMAGMSGMQGTGTQVPWWQFWR